MNERPQLSKRERESMAAEALRLSPEEAGMALGISADAVRKYQSVARGKLGGRTKREAVRQFVVHFGDDITSEPYAAFRGMAGVIGPAPFAEPVEHDSARLSDVAVDRARMADRRSILRELADVLSGERPGTLSTATRNLIMLATAIGGGMIFFALSVGFALVTPLAKLVRALFP